MNDRIKKLRTQSLQAEPSISMERVKLLTEFYKSGKAEKVSIPVARALAFKHILKNKKLCINDGELIVGERGPLPKATPTYPEICTHSRNDLEILNSRPKVNYLCAEDSMKFQEEEVIPFWNGKNIRERIFEEIDPEWKDAYTAGVFTEFQEQRAPGHTVLDDKIYKRGFKNFITDIDDAISSLDFYNDKEAFEKREQLRAMRISAEALITYSKRYSNKLKELAETKQDEIRKKELIELSEICERVPENKPRTFHEALQYYWFVHVGIITELNTWDSFNPGRLDQHLYPFYKKEIQEGILTKEKAKEILQSFWVKFNNQPAPPKVGVTALESNTYTDFALINVGGLKEDGSDAVNELSYLILDVIEEMRLLQPSSMVQISKKNPDKFLKRALKIIKTGFGQPSIFNTDTLIQEMVRQGKSLSDARNGGASGCVETGAFGKESYILTGYFNLTKILELTLNNGFDPKTQKQIGLKTGDTESFETFEELFDAYKKQLNHFIDIKIKGNIIIERLFADYMPAPFMSLLIDDCIKKGRDYNEGGARYNTSYIQGVGLGSLTNSLSAIKNHVYDKSILSMGELILALKNNFEDFENMRQSLLNDAPKYGNDDDYADEIMTGIFEAFYNSVEGRSNTKGGQFRINLLPTTSHVYFGSVIGATPDGRKAKEPLSEGISPVQGTDLNGPTAVIKSAAKIDHIRTGGTLLNQKFTPQILDSDEGINKVAQLVRTYFKMDGHHIQFNVIDVDTLRKAQKHPEQYKDLIVRVAGYSDYFVDLNEDLQNEIIKRTEHKEF